MSVDAGGCWCRWVLASVGAGVGGFLRTKQQATNTHLEKLNTQKMTRIRMVRKYKPLSVTHTKVVILRKRRTS